MVPRIKIRSDCFAMKRAFDLVVSAVSLILLSPCILIVAILVRLKLGAPILFTQSRPGKNDRVFEIFKFRSMTSETDQHGNLLPDETRLTKFGRFMRATSLDELPGLVNVLKGDMSLVGPRPLLVEYLPRYNARQKRRHEVKPGITGWAQVNGRNAVSWEERFELDVWYVENQSFLLDLKILVMTVGKVVRRSGVSAAGHATMPKFQGSESREGAE